MTGRFIHFRRRRTSGRWTGEEAYGLMIIGGIGDPAIVWWMESPSDSI